MHYGYVMVDRSVNLLSKMLSGFAVLTGPVLGLLSYVLTGMSLYTLATRRGLRHAWLSWVPVANVWVLGSLADQYRYVARGEVRFRRRSLLTLRIFTTVLSAVLTGIGVVIVVGFVGAHMGALNPNRFFPWVTGPALGAAAIGLSLAAVTVAYWVIYFMAIYDLFRSSDPQNATLFLVLAILFSVTRPFFLFACRNKDLGMPPRRTEYTAEPQNFQ